MIRNPVLIKNRMLIKSIFRQNKISKPRNQTHLKIRNKSKLL
jgi:hypothetical protein